MPPTPRFVLPGLALAVAVALGLSACGGGSSKAHGSSSATSAANAGTNGNATAASQAFDECLRSHGVTPPSRPSAGATPPSAGATPPSAPDGNGGGGFGGPSGAGSGFTNDPEMQEAFNACRSKLPDNGQFDTAQGQALVDCLRKNGVTVPATTQNDGNVLGSLDQTDPNVAQALQACRSQLGSRPRSSTTTAPTRS